MRGLAFDADARHASGEVSLLSLGPEEIRGLLLLCHQHDRQPLGSEPLASARQLSIRERLRGLVLDAYVQQRPAQRLRQYALLTTFIFNGGSARAATMAHAQAGLPDPTLGAQVRLAQISADSFLRFAADRLNQIEEQRLRRQQRRETGYQAAVLNCLEQCGRQSDGSAHGQGGSGCPSCPMHGV